jgi:tetratricopeptide (TPR) repeat protein
MMKCLVTLVLALGLAGDAMRAAGTPAPAAPATEPAPPPPSLAEQGLQALVARQQELLGAAAKGGDKFDEENFRTQMQDLANDYDTYLKKNPDYAPAYAAYGVMLGKISMRRQSVAMLLKADELFAGEAQKDGARTPALLRTWALVKNQLGNYVAEEGKPLQAVTYFLDAIDLTPNEPLYHYQLGTLLTEARDDFLKNGQWTRAALDQAAHSSFQHAAELAPGRIEFGYRYAESFADQEVPDWDGALKAWAALEEKATSDFDRQTMRLQAANILIRQQKLEYARMLLDTVTVEPLLKQKQKLVEALNAAGAAAPAVPPAAPPATPAAAPVTGPAAAPAK